jgi:hypothetical protein
MRVYRTQTDASEPSVHAHYLYAEGGQRAKKLVRKQGGQIEVTIYIDGIFEYQRIVRGGVVEENSTLHMMDNQSQIALVRVGRPFTNDHTPAVKYHLGDHLGSSNLVIDKHLLKRGLDKSVIDLTDFTAVERRAVFMHLPRLRPADRARLMLQWSRP